MSISLLRSKKCFAEQPSKVFSNWIFDFIIVYVYADHCSDEWLIQDVANLYKLLSLKLQRKYVIQKRFIRIKRNKLTVLGIRDSSSNGASKPGKDFQISCSSS
jgi:hypothetical protein